MPEMTVKENARVTAIDRGRGLLVFCMILCQIAGEFGCFGLFGRIGMHEERGLTLFPGYTLADLGEPLFLLLLALSFTLSFKKRLARDGSKKTYAHFFLRFSSIIGVGYLTRVLDVIDRQYVKFKILGGVLAGIWVCLALLFLLFKLLRKPVSAVMGTMTLHFLALLGIVNIAIAFYTGFILTEPILYWFYVKWWTVFASIGAAGLLLLMFAQSSMLARCIAAGSLLLFFTMFHQMPGNMDLIDFDTQGGIWGVLAWGAMLLIFSVMANLYYADRKAKEEQQRGLSAHRFLIGQAVLTVWGVVGALLLPINKGSASPGYILASLPMACLLFYLVSLTEKWQPKYPVLTWWGKNPLVLFFLQIVVNDAAFLLFDTIAPVPFAVALLYLVLVFAGLTWICYTLQKRNIYIRF